MSSCNCQPQSFPFTCQRGNCPLKDCRPARFDSMEQVIALRGGKPKTKEVERPTATEFPCQHRGDVLRQEGCGCGGKPKIDVHSCSVHGECTIYSPGKVLRKSDKSGRIPACITCNDICDPG